MSLEISHLPVYFLFIYVDVDALRFETDVFVPIMLSRYHLRGRTHDAGSPTRISFKYKLTGFRN